MEARLHDKPKQNEASRKGKGAPSPWDSLSITALEADLAYFHARLEWIGKNPETRNQKAQLDTFSMLIPAFGKIVSHLKRKTVVKS